MVGINLSQSGNLIDHVTTNRNGMSGIEIGTGGPVITNETMQYSEMDGNNTHHFNASPSSGGIKVGTVNGLVIKWQSTSRTTSGSTGSGPIRTSPTSPSSTTW